MNKRMMLKIENLRLNLKKKVFNEKYLVRNTMAFVAGASALGMMACGIALIKGNVSNKSEDVKVAVASATDEAGLNVAPIDMMDDDSIVSLMTALDSNAKMVVAANDFQVVAQTQDEITAEGEGITVTPVTEEETTTEETTTEAPTTETPTTEETTTEATTTEETTTEAPDNSQDKYRTPEHTQRGSYSLTDEEIKLMACVLTLECGNQSYEGQLAVANLILNRLDTGAWGSSVKNVLYAQNQFSVVNTVAFENCMKNGPQASCVKAVKQAAKGDNNIGSYLSYRATYSVNVNSYSDCIIIGDHIFF